TGTLFRIQLGVTLASGGLGLLISPWLTIKPFYALRQKIKQLPARRLLAAGLGLALGLALSLPLDYALSFLSPPWGQIGPGLASVTLGLLGSAILVFREDDVALFLGGRFAREGPARPSERAVLLDSSVIIDGRIRDISRTGFIEGGLLIPRFILDEVQYIADSPDTLRRNRGRRGLETLNQLQKEASVPVRIIEAEVEGARDVDGKLVVLAKRLRCPILTNDYNLNRVAELQGVRVLNINELANAVKPIFLPGESLRVQLIQEGKEVGQGVGYLDDGTMVVVENGRKFIGNTIEVIVTRMLQTTAGRMIFAQPTEDRRDR
ncbi:MAG: TRAM domain-containing protein, partial [Chloroflexi bacterium]|nr:TRAM domain-containing protein [Chloroflexota bacterium]